MKSIKANPNPAKGPDKGKIVLHIIDNTTLKKMSPSVFSCKKEYAKNYDAILLSKYDSAEKRY